MRVTSRELGLWSFLMSGSHGAGLMVAPVLIAGGGETAVAHDGHAHAGTGGLSMAEAALGLVLHVGAMVVAMGLVAVLVYEKLGVAVLRRTWVNTEHVWAGAFVLAGLVTFFT
jgi:hypothetical protein